MPNVGLKYQLDERDQLFYSLSRNMRVPQNYVLYDPGTGSIDSKPETSWNHELGWRYTEQDMTLAATLFYLQFKDRQVSSKTSTATLPISTPVQSTTAGWNWNGVACCRTTSITTPRTPTPAPNRKMT